jgi:hypothetical protein
MNTPSSPSDDERFKEAPHLIEWIPRPRTLEDAKFSTLHRDTCPAKKNKDATCVCGGTAR